MIDWAAAHFGTGLDAASSLRSALLGGLGAEQEWLSWDSEEDTVSWITGPLATAFSVRPASSLTPGLGVVHISTRCAWVDDIVIAEGMVASLNLTATVNRWTIHDQPLPSEWTELDEDSDEEPDEVVLARRLALLPLPGESATPAVHNELSVITGDGAAELPLAAVIAGVREQIAKATAVATYEHAALMWIPAAVTMAGRAREAQEWHEVVYHYDNVITPASGADARPLLAALTTALSRAQAEQGETGSAVWAGTGNNDGLTCEVPYGEGPFPLGLVSTGHIPHLSGPETSTSLVQSSIIDHSWLGQGLMLTLRPGSGPKSDEPALAAALLNQLLSAGRLGEAVTHGWGAWIYNQLFMHTVFLPAAWATQLDQHDLEQLMRCLLDDAARLSRLSRVVIEPLCDAAQEDELLAGALPVYGLAAGHMSRGLTFGENGVGTDPGARLLARLWHDMVAGDSQWAVLDIDDGVGFDYWPNEHRQRFRSTPCGHGDGADVTVETLLGPVNRELSLRPLPGAMVTTEDGRVLRTVLHVHDDSLSWLAGWCTPLAVSQALLASKIADPTPAPAALPLHPLLGPRPETDQMLELFDAGTPWFDSAANPLSHAVVALATSIPEPVPHAARVARDDTIEIDWLLQTQQDAASKRGSVTTAVQRYQDDVLGTCLLLRTVVAVDGTEDTWSERANALLTSGRDVTVVGGFRSADGAVSFTSLIPVALDRATWLTGWMSHVGTCLSHHISGVQEVALGLGGITAVPVSVAALAQGLRSLPSFYLRAGVTRDEAEFEVSESGDGTAAEVVIARSLPTAPADADGSPLLGSVEASDGHQTLRTRISIPLSGDVALGIRLVHSAIVQPGGNRDTTDPYLARRTTGAVADRELEGALQDALDGGDLVVGEDGSPYVLTAPGAPLIRVEYDGNAPHSTWGEAPTVRGVVIGAQRAAGTATGIGSWTATEDGPAYTVSLPPFALACPYADRRLDMLRYAISEVARMCELVANERTGLQRG